MGNVLYRAMQVTIVFAMIVLLVWVGWLIFRWNAGVDGFVLVRGYIRDEIGLSLATATVIAVAAGIACFILVSVLTIKTNLLMTVIVVILVVGVPISLWVDSLASGHCFNRQSGKALCELWETPDGIYQIRRMDAAAPQHGWSLVRNATHDDVKNYSGNPKEQESRVPRPVPLESCASNPQFFDAAGKAKIYWSRNGDVFELWDRGGAHPTTGVPLQAMTSETAVQICKRLATEKQQRDEKLMKERLAQAVQTPKRERQDEGYQNSMTGKKNTVEQTTLQPTRGQAQEKYLDALISSSKGRLVNVALFQNATSFQVSNNLGVNALREFLHSRCNATVIDRSQATPSEIIARNGDVLTASARLIEAGFIRPNPQYGDGSHLVIVNVIIDIRIKSEARNQEILLKTLDARQTYFANELSTQPQSALVERAVMSIFSNIASEVNCDNVFSMAAF